jgi:hypothetical protein
VYLTLLSKQKEEKEAESLVNKDDDKEIKQENVVIQVQP